MLNLAHGMPGVDLSWWISAGTFAAAVIVCIVLLAAAVLGFTDRET